MPVSDFMHDGDLVRRMDKLERLLMEFLSGRSLQNASVTVPDTGLSFRGGGHVVIEGGSGLDVNDQGDVNLNDGSTLTINGGSLRMTSQDGTVGLLYFGPGTGGDGRTWQFSFPDGEAAFGLLGYTGAGFWGGKDNAGNLILSNDAGSGSGLARPYLNIPMVPSTASQHQSGGPFWPATNSSSYVELMHGFTTIWHPRIAFGMDTAASGGATEWRLLISGDLIASGSGDVSGTYDIPGWGDTIDPGNEKVIQVEVRNTTGNVSWAQVDKCYGTQS